MRYIEVNLPVGQLVAMVDDEDFERVNQFRWRGCSRKHYAQTVKMKAGNRQQFAMHRFVLGISDLQIRIHHFDNDPLNNQKHNLSLATTLENCRGKVRKPKGSTSRFRGVFWDSRAKKWRANINLGSFDSEEAAAKEWNRVSEFAWGNRGQLNNLPEEVTFSGMGVAGAVND